MAEYDGLHVTKGSMRKGEGYEVVYVGNGRGRSSQQYPEFAGVVRGMLDNSRWLPHNYWRRTPTLSGLSDEEELAVKGICSVLARNSELELMVSKPGEDDIPF